MKKLLFVFLLLFIALPCFAKTIAVEALEEFSTENPPEYLFVKINTDIKLDKDLTLLQGYVVKGQLTDVSDPKRLKRNAVFSFVPLSYTDNNNVNYDINGYYTGKYTTELNKKGLAKNAALSVGNYFVKGLSLGYSAVEGAIKNEDDNRLKSGAKNVYENSPISLVEKGQELTIKEGEIFFLKFKEYNEKDEPNYEYTDLNSSDN